MSGTVVSNTDPAAIESGNSWNGLDTAGAPVIETFSFPTSIPSYDTSIGGFTASTISSFSAFTAAEQTEAISALNQWAAASGIVFVEVAPGAGDITFANVDFSTTTPNSDNGNYQNAGGIGFYPFGDWSYSTGNSTTGYGFDSDLSTAGDVYMNSQDITNGTVDIGTLLHEIGHAIGMKHPDQTVYTADGTLHNQILDPTENAGTITVMSETNDAGGAITGLFSLDQSAAASLYGPAGTGGVYTSSASGTNSVSNWNWNATTSTLTQTAVTASETIHGTSVNDIIYGYDYGGSVATSGSIALFGLDGTNTLYAGSGTTSLYGGPDANTLVGGAGNDSFYVYSTNTTVTDAYTTGENTLYATGVNFTLPTNVTTLYLFGAGLTGTGNNQNNSIFGDGIYANTLVAGSGNDYMVGGSGGNTLITGSGIDTLYGGSGANRFVFGSVADAPLNTGNGNDYIGDFKEGTDTLDLSGIANAFGHNLTFIGNAALTAPGQVNATTSGGYTFIEGDITSAGSADFEIQLNGTSTLQPTDFALATTACYAPGTHIATADGDCAIELLAIGDLLRTANGALRPVKWIARRSYAAPFAHRNTGLWPVVIRAGALAEGVPARNLSVSPLHAMFIDGVLVPAEALLNGTSICQPEPTGDVAYVHVELDTHDVILAEGAASESFVDDDSRQMFQNAEEYARLYPDEARRHIVYCAPRVTQGFALDAIRRRVAVRAGMAAEMARA
jgi:Ca2+-binding RTX toxin-like protein